MSTLLVSDLDSLLITGLSHSGKTLYIANYSTSSNPYPRNYASYAPVSFPTFAEWSNHSIINAIDGVDDTGPIVRALLPFALASTRQQLQNYSGPATVIHPRVICMRPNIVNLAFSDSNNGTISGRIQPPSEVFDVQFDSNRTQNAYSSFSCLVQPAKDMREWAMSLCEPISSFNDRILTTVTGHK
jgi:hypothetical protein